jgi:hypothetical protein
MCGISAFTTSVVHPCRQAVIGYTPGVHFKAYAFHTLLRSATLIPYIVDILNKELT